MKTPKKSFNENPFNLKENRIVFMSGGAPEKIPVTSVEAKREEVVGKEVTNYGCLPGTKVKEYSDGLYELSDGSTIQEIDVGGGEKRLLRLDGSIRRNEAGEKLVETAETKTKIETKYEETKAKLDELKKTGLAAAETLEGAEKEAAKKAAEEAHAKGLKELEEVKETALSKIKTIDKIEAKALKDIMEAFGGSAKEVEEGSYESAAELSADIKEALEKANSGRDVKKWMAESLGNRNKMRSLVLEGLGEGEKAGPSTGVITIKFEKAKTELGLTDAQYKHLKNGVSIGSLFDDNEMKFIDKVKGIQGRKGEGESITVPATTHYSKDGKRGVYHETKYLRIWNGSEIHFSARELPEQHESGKKAAPAASAEASAPTTAEVAAASTSAPATADVPKKLTPETPEKGKVAVIKDAKDEPVEYTVEGGKYVVEGKKLDKKTFDYVLGLEVPKDPEIIKVFKSKYKKFNAEPTELDYDADSKKMTCEYSNDNAKITAEYSVETGEFSLAKGSPCTELLTILKDATPENVAWLGLQLGEELVAADFTEEMKEKDILKQLANGNLKEALEEIVEQKKPSLTVVAYILRNLDLNEVDTDVVNKLAEKMKGKYADLIKEFRELNLAELYELEKLNGGEFDVKKDEKVIGAIAEKFNASDYSDGNNEEIELLYNKYGDDVRIQKLALEVGYHGCSGDSLYDGNYMLRFNSYPEGELKNIQSKGAIKNIVDAWRTDDNYGGSLDDFNSDFVEEPTGEDLTKAREEFKKRATIVLDKYLAKNTNKAWATDGQEFKAYELMYDSDPTAKASQNADVYARYLVSKGKSLTDTGIIDGTTSNGWNPGNAEKAIQAYVQYSDGPSLGFVGNDDITVVMMDAITKAVKSLANSGDEKAKVLLANIDNQRDSIDKDLDKKEIQANYDSLVSVAKSSNDPKAKLLALKELESSYYESKYGAGLLTLVGNSVAEHKAFIAKHKYIAKFESMDFASMPTDVKEDDKDIKPLAEFIEYINGSKRIGSLKGLNDVMNAKHVTAKHLRDLADKKDPADDTKYLISFPLHRIMIYKKIGLEGKANDLLKANENKDKGYDKYFEAQTAKGAKEKKAALIAAINAFTPDMLSELDADYELDYSVTILEELLKLKVSVDTLKATNYIASLNPDANSSLTYKRAVLKARLLRARTEIMQCGGEAEIDKFLASLDKDVTSIPDRDNMAEALCQKPALVDEVSKYFKLLEEIGEEPSKEDMAMLKDIHEIYTGGDWEEDIKVYDDTGAEAEDATKANKDAYIALMIKLSESEEEDGAKYLDEIKEEDIPADKKVSYYKTKKEFLKAAEAETAEDKKLDLYKEAFKAEEKLDKKAEIVETVTDLNSQAALIEAYALYTALADAKYATAYADIVNKVMLDADGKKRDYLKEEVEGWLDDISLKGRGPLMAKACEAYALYASLLEKVYKVDKKMEVKVHLLVQQGDDQAIIDFLLADKRDDSKFVVSTDTDEKDKITTWYEGMKDEIDSMETESRDKILKRLGQ
ncbi:hypothetical protein HOG17_04690 [Candidatus Peregrinibacteria bacterium]|nr:hypothetical protein [Candidatus Peregrinibacteria bacterium]MBT4147863.1 hypothetical protein [Candidatus Peregrinibacteria bacterium]MBT4456309.1 hypothetical protein [Candidatus Peregrinibacteria bacterium]